MRTKPENHFRISEAVLYGPASTAKLLPASSPLHSHVLIAQLPPEVVDRLRKPGAPAALQVRFALTPKGIACAALVIQTSSLQVIFVVRLLTSLAQGWLMEATSGQGEFVCAFNSRGTTRVDVAHYSVSVNTAFQSTLSSIRLALPRQPRDMDVITQRMELQEAIAAFADSGKSLLAEFPVLAETWYLIATDDADAAE